MRSASTGWLFSMLMKTTFLPAATIGAASSALVASTNWAPCFATISWISTARSRAASRDLASPSGVRGPCGVKMAKKPPSTPPSIMRG